MKTLVWLVAALMVGLAPTACARDAIPVYGYHVVHRYPHDPHAYTEGLLYHDGFLYESTGQVGASTVRKVELATGKVLQSSPTPWPDYGEGIAIWKDRLIQLTWKNEEGFVYDLATLKPLAKFPYPGEGWALTSDGKALYMSDGTPTIRVLDPNTLKQTGSIAVTANGKPLANINELEWVKGEIWANVWLTTRIARINPATGKVVGWIELGGLVPPASTLADPLNDVLNGIAYDSAHDRIYVTGKCWPWLYEIKLTPPATRR